MKAIFEVKTIQTQWKPPFKKTSTENQFKVSEGETFDHINANGNDEDIFQLIKIKGDKALIRHSRVFTIKNPATAQIEKDRGLWLTIEKSEALTYLWGEQGITKIITYKGLSEELDEQTKQEIAEDLIIQQAQ
jgi:hypothetical protein